MAAAVICGGILLIGIVIGGIIGFKIGKAVQEEENTVSV